MKPQLFDITGWNEQSWVSTGGTRSKKFVQAPDGNYYYYKRSYKTEGREYFFEFWGEIIASLIGKQLGFDMLTYDLAIDGNEMGCLSISMIEESAEELIEGGKYLQAWERKFDPQIKDGRKLYSFQLIVKALEAFQRDEYIEQILEHIVFDSLIGNGDRHQENWAFITTITPIPKALKEIEIAARAGELKSPPNWIKYLGLKNLISKMIDLDKKELKPEAKRIQLYMQKVKGMAPIFDSGSSLGRELVQEKVATMLEDEVQLNAYINRGSAEIRWKNNKLNHFDLISYLLGTSYSEIVLKIISRIEDSFQVNNIESIVNDVDFEVPKSHQRFQLPEARKRLIIKLVTLRYKRLIALRNERV